MTINDGATRLLLGRGVLEPQEMNVVVGEDEPQVVRGRSPAQNCEVSVKGRQPAANTEAKMMPTDALPPERISEIRRRIETGWYDTPEITGEIARRLYNSGDLGSNQGESESVSGTRPGRDELLRDSEAMLREAAEILVDLLDTNESRRPTASDRLAELTASELAPRYRELSLEIGWWVAEMKAIQVQVHQGLLRVSAILDRFLGPVDDAATPVLPNGQRRRALASEVREEIRRLLALSRSHDLLAHEVAAAARAMKGAEGALAGRDSEAATASRASRSQR